MTSVTKLSYAAPPPCGDQASDVCIPPTDAALTTTAPTATGLDWTVAAPQADVKVKVVSAPTGVTASLFEGKLSVKRPAVGGTGCLALHVTNDCGSAVWMITIPAQCVLPCITAGPLISADTSGEATTTIKLLGPATSVVSQTGLDKATVTVFKDTLSILGTVVAGAYSVTLDSPCGQCKITGNIEVEVPDPVCEPLRLLGSSGDFSVAIGDTVNVCYSVAGSRPVQLVNYEGLPLGLNVTITPDGPNSKVCLTGTVIEDKCTPDAGCRTGKITLKNCGGTFDVIPKVFVAAAPAPKPVFCAGMVNIEEVFTNIPAASRCWLITANFFPPNTKITIRTGTGIAGTGNDIEGTFLVKDLNIGTDGSGSLRTCTGVSFSGCNTFAIWAYHPTCAVITNNAQLTGLITAGNDCTTNTGGNGNP